MASVMRAALDTLIKRIESTSPTYDNQARFRHCEMGLESLIEVDTVPDARSFDLSPDFEFELTPHYDRNPLMLRLTLRVLYPDTNQRIEVIKQVVSDFEDLYNRLHYVAGSSDWLDSATVSVEGSDCAALGDYHVLSVRITLTYDRI